MDVPGTPGVSDMSTLVFLSNQKDNSNGGLNQENPCPIETVTLKTSPTPNHGFIHPKHLRNSSDFVMETIHKNYPSHI